MAFGPREEILTAIPDGCGQVGTDCVKRGVPLEGDLAHVMVWESHALRAVRPANEELPPLVIVSHHALADHDAELEVRVEPEQFVGLARDPEHGVLSTRGGREEPTGFPAVDVAPFSEIARSFESPRFRAVDPAFEAVFAQKRDRFGTPLAFQDLVARRWSGQEHGGIAERGKLCIVVELDLGICPHGLEFGQQGFVRYQVAFLSIECGHDASS